MTKLITSIADKKDAFDLLDVVLQRFLFGALKHDDVQALRIHLGMMRHHPHPLNVLCTFATNPETQSTRVILEYSFRAPDANRS